MSRAGAVLLLVVAACGKTRQDRAEPPAAGGQPTDDELPVVAAGMPAIPPSGGEGGAAGMPTTDRGGEVSGGGSAGEGGSPEPCQLSRFATSVVEHAFGGGQSFNQERFPEPLLGPPQANEPRAVVSLGDGGFVVLAFEGTAIVDGPGVDFTVFENPLPTYRELGTVAVSEDGQTWREFPCTAPVDGPDYGACAGVKLVHSSSSNGVSPLDPAVSGGDSFDLAEVGLERARFVRITDRANQPDVFDLDGVAIVNAECL